MILLLGIAAGIITGLVRALVQKTNYQLPEPTGTWLVAAAVLPQILVFHLPWTAQWFPPTAAAAVLVSSQMILLVFVWKNRRFPSFLVMGIGLLLNLTVILLNGGLMPLAPETAAELFPEYPAHTWQSGIRPGRSKNIILKSQATVLPGLSDSILLPDWFPWSRAVSAGDLLITLGVFWFLGFARLARNQSPDKNTP